MDWNLSLDPTERDESLDALSETFFALSDPTRRLILDRLRKGPATVKELIEPVRISAPAVTKHLKILERAGLIARGRDAQFRPCTIRPSAMQKASDWLLEYKASWQDNFDRLEASLEADES